MLNNDALLKFVADAEMLYAEVKEYKKLILKLNGNFIVYKKVDSDWISVYHGVQSNSAIEAYNDLIPKT